jgi:hypothetical protein
MNSTTPSSSGNLQHAGLVVGISGGALVITVIIIMIISYYNIKKKEAANEIVLPVYANILNHHQTRSLMPRTSAAGTV